MNKTNPSVDGYIRKSKEWRDVLQRLREVVLSCDLTEEIKWRTPCYMFEGTNVVMIGYFKEGCVLSFLKGALLKDEKGLLLKPGENTQSARIIRFTSVQQIVENEPILKAYVNEAIEVEKAGLKVSFKKIEEHAVPEEFQKQLDENPALKSTFKDLTPGRQRAYLLHFSSAKQSKTRAARVEKYTKHILNGKGIDDE